jgi:RNA polymerase primary sigma factor
MAEHERLVCWVVRRQYLGKLSFIDALQEGRIGLWRALRKYDPSRGTAFSTYAVPAISRAVWKAVSDHQTSIGPSFLPSPESIADMDSDYSDPIEAIHNSEVCAELHRLVGELPSRLQQVVKAHYGLQTGVPQTYAVIGVRWGITRQRVQQLHMIALLYLAQPMRSLRLRALLGRQTRADYQRTLARQRHQARMRRRSRRVAK